MQKHAKTVARSGKPNTIEKGSNKTVIRQDAPSQEDVIFQAWVKGPPSYQSPKVGAFLRSGELRNTM
jgi:hypothetical protein